jgi:hypothetical protein
LDLVSAGVEAAAFVSTALLVADGVDAPSSSPPSSFVSSSSSPVSPFFV